MYDANDRLLSAGGVTFGYDDNGNLLSQIEPLRGTATYTDDGANRLVGVRQPNAGVSVQFRYDALGNRVQSSGPNGTTSYLVDPFAANGLAQVVRESGAAGNAVNYVYGADPISQGGASATSFFLHDGQMSTRALADASGNLTDRYDFDAYGNLLTRSGATFNSYLYGGQRLDAATGYYDLRARFYSPTQGRFVSRDPVAGSVFDPPSLNAYLYARDDPVDFADPSGRQYDFVSVSMAQSNRHHPGQHRGEILASRLSTNCATAATPGSPVWPPAYLAISDARLARRSSVGC